MLPRDAFVAGLAAFLVAHVCYVVGFWTDPPAATAMVVASVVVVLAVAPIARTHPARARDRAGAAAAGRGLHGGDRGDGRVRGRVGQRRRRGRRGAFAGSDSLIAWNRFVRPLAGAGVAIMVTYHLGQILLTLSLLARTRNLGDVIR